MLLASAHQAPDGDHRRVHDTQLAMARQEGAAPQQEGHGARHIGAGQSQASAAPRHATPPPDWSTRRRVTQPMRDWREYCTRYLVAGSHALHVTLVASSNIGRKVLFYKVVDCIYIVSYER